MPFSQELGIRTLPENYVLRVPTSEAVAEHISLAKQGTSLTKITRSRWHYLREFTFNKEKILHQQHVIIQNNCYHVFGIKMQDDETT